MIIAAMPCDTFGKVVYSKFHDIMYKVRYTTIRNAMQEKNATATEKAIMELCRAKERESMDPPATAADEPAYVGMVNTKQLQDALADQKIGLTRLQVTSVMCDAEILDGMVDYWKARARARALSLALGDEAEAPLRATTGSSCRSRPRRSSRCSTRRTSRRRPRSWRRRR